MFHQRPLLLLITLFVLISLACNAFAGNVEPELELPPPTFVATLVAGAEVTVEGAAATVTLPAGTETVVATAVPPLQGPYVTMLVDLNVRTGPGVQYDRVGFLLKGESAPILGVDPASGWWKIQCPATILTSECWISGGAEYAQANNASGVPAAAVPPTPTPPPSPTPTVTPVPTTGTIVTASDPGLLAYADDTGLWAVPLDLSQNPPTAGTPVQLATESNISNPLISPDGKRIAFLRGDNESNELAYVNSNGEGGGLLASSTNIPNASGSSDVTVLIDQVQWLPNSQSVAFSSYVLNKTGPGAVPQSDLWLVSVGGSLQERFTAGDGGHRFNISPDGARVIFSLPESIVQANLDGSNRQTVLNFGFVNTASEYAYVPLVQWLANGSTAVTAVSSPDPWQPSANASLYRIQNSNAFVNGNVLGNILFSPVLWPEDGSQTAYVQFIPDGSNTQTLVLADSSGAKPIAYRQGQNLRLFGWSPDGSRVLYAGEGFVGVGQADEAPAELVLPVGLGDAQWLNSTAYVMNLGTGDSWNVTSGNLAGGTELLVTATGNNVQFDIWVP